MFGCWPGWQVNIVQDRRTDVIPQVGCWNQRRILVKSACHQPTGNMMVMYKHVRQLERRPAKWLYRQEQRNLSAEITTGNLKLGDLKKRGTEIKKDHDLAMELRPHRPPASRGYE